MISVLIFRCLFLLLLFSAVLQYHRNAVAEGLHAVLADIPAADENFALSCVIKARDELDERGLR